MLTNPPWTRGGAFAHALRRIGKLIGSATMAVPDVLTAGAPAPAVTPTRSRSPWIALSLGLPALGDDPDHDCPAAADDHDLWWAGEPDGAESGAAAGRTDADRAMTELSLSYQERPGVDAIEALERLSLSGRRTRGRDPWASGPIHALDRLG